MPITDKVIFILSPEPWGTSFVSKHHYASLLAEQGNEVFFINPPAQKFNLSQISPNLWVVDYSVGLLRGINRLPAFLRNILNRILIRKIIKYIGKKPDIVWSFDPFRFQNLGLFPTACKIYHPVDVHQTLLEIQAVETADVVFSTAHKILAGFEKAKTPKYFINHGLAAHFLENPVDIDFKADKNMIKVGYVGNMNYQYLDKEILYRILTEHSNIHFYFIGPYEKSNLSGAFNSGFINTIKELPNVELLGPKPSKELPAYLKQFDLFLMCYSGDRNVAQMANPHKILEYLSTGKPVLSHFIDEYKDKPDLVLMVAENKDLPALFSDSIVALETLNSPELQSKRKTFAAENSYIKQLDRITALLAKHCQNCVK